MCVDAAGWTQVCRDESFGLIAVTRKTLDRDYYFPNMLMMGYCMKVLANVTSGMVANIMCMYIHSMYCAWWLDNKGSATAVQCLTRHGNGEVTRDDD